MAKLTQVTEKTITKTRVNYIKGINFGGMLTERISKLYAEICKVVY